MNVNYQKELEKTIQKHVDAGEVKKLLLHSCCAPCSSYVLEYLSDFFEITVFYYNPNLFPDDEYVLRAKEQQEFINKFSAKYSIDYLEGEFDKGNFYESVKGLEMEPEGGRRCFLCYQLRLGKTAEMAKFLGFDYFATTLTISPLKNADRLNEIGELLGMEYGVSYLKSDFKKKNGFKRSIELSKVYNMYRQEYCGCLFSKQRN